MAVTRLGGSSKRNSEAAVLVAATQLGVDDIVEIVVAGRFLGHNGVALVAGTRVVLANDRPFKPDIVTLRITPGFEVAGWAEDRSAVLEFTSGGDSHVIDQIRDTPIAQELAGNVRAKA